MTSLAVKAIAGTTVAVGGSIYGGYLLITKTTIRERLEKDKYTVLDTKESPTSENSKWKEKAGKWDEMTDFINNKDTSINTEELKIQKIKEKCQEILDTEGSDKDYENAKKYCAVQEEKQ